MENLKELLQNEKNLMEDALNGVILLDELELKQQVILTIEDAINIRKLDEKWKVNVKELVNKLEMLNDEEVYEIVNGF